MEEGADAHMGRATSSEDGLGRRLTGEGEEEARRDAGRRRWPCHTDGLGTSHSNLPRHICPSQHRKGDLDKLLV